MTEFNFRQSKHIRTFPGLITTTVGDDHGELGVPSITPKAIILYYSPVSFFSKADDIV